MVCRYGVGYWPIKMYNGCWVVVVDVFEMYFYLHEIFGLSIK